MGKTVTFRTLIEVLGKPQEHVDATLKSFVEKIKNTEEYTLLAEDYADLKKQEDSDLWAGFAELEIKADKIEDLTTFCFDFMPSMIEIIEPSEVSFTDLEISQFLSDLQAKLHRVDMVAKQLKAENDFLKSNMTNLMKNFILVLLKNGDLSSEQLNKITGVDQDRIEDFLDHLMDEGRVDLKNGVYSLSQEQ